MKWTSKIDKVNSERIIPSFFSKIKCLLTPIGTWAKKVLDPFKICQTNKDCSFPLTCCDGSFFKTCCKEGGTRENLHYPHPYFSRPVRVKAHYDNLDGK
jgi:hypothetical protein